MQTHANQYPQHMQNVEHNDRHRRDQETISALKAEKIQPSMRDVFGSVTERLDPNPALAQAEAALARVRELHADAGESQGYVDDGAYGYIEHCCAACGTFGEYGTPWPCATIRALDETQDQR